MNVSKCTNRLAIWNVNSMGINKLYGNQTKMYYSDFYIKCGIIDIMVSLSFKCSWKTA